MRGTDPMNSCRGSAIVLSMLLMVILSALGMYAVSVPVGTGESASRHHRAAVARNMARAGANAAIARFPVLNPVGSAYVRRIPVGRNVTGRYSVTSRKVRTGFRGGRDRSVRWRCAYQGEDPVRSGIRCPQGQNRTMGGVRSPLTFFVAPLLHMGSKMGIDAASPSRL
jgi:hypothetical protein